MKPILIADDDRVMIRLYQMHFRNAPYQTFFFQSGEEALKELDVIQPALAILDYDLIDIKGVDLMKKIHQQDSLATIPIIFVTGQGKNSVQKDLLAQGASEIFTKPFSPLRLLKTVENLLRD